MAERLLDEPRDHGPVGPGVEHDADPAAAADVGRPEVALGIRLDERLLRTQRRGKPDRQVRGAVVVDAGAAAKVRDEGKSLLPIGMTAVEGDFSRGDVIAVRDAAGAEIARGLANYAAAEARLLCRKPSAEFEKLLGYAAEPEMVHRDNLVLAAV